MPIELTRSRRWNSSLLIVYLIGVFVLFEQEKNANLPAFAEILPWIRIGELILLGEVLFRIQYRENPWYIVLMLAIPLIFVTSALRSASALNKSKTILNIAVFVYLLCPAVPLLVGDAELKRFLKILIALWTIIHVGLCLAGLYAVVNDIQIANYSGTSFIGLNEYQRLCLWDYSNLSSIVLVVSIMFSLIGAAISNRKGISVLYLLSAVLMFICQSMTGSRSSEFVMLIGFGVAAACLFQKPFAQKIKREWLRILLSVLLVIVIVMLGILMIQWTRAGASQFLNRPVISVANAETIVKEQSIQGGRFFYTGNDFLAGRIMIWQESIQALRIKPRLLVTGTSIPTLIRDLKKFTDMPEVSHLYNVFLQITLSTGLFGAFLCLIFVFFAIRASIRLFFDYDRPLWKRFLFLPFLCLLLIDQVEFVMLTAQPDLNGVVMLFTGAAIIAADKNRMEQKYTIEQ